jgi:hypothetical protein
MRLRKKGYCYQVFRFTGIALAPACSLAGLSRPSCPPRGGADAGRRPMPRHFFTPSPFTSFQGGGLISCSRAPPADCVWPCQDCRGSLSGNRRTCRADSEQRDVATIGPDSRTLKPCARENRVSSQSLTPARLGFHITRRRWERGRLKHTIRARHVKKYMDVST